MDHAMVLSRVTSERFANLVSHTHSYISVNEGRERAESAERRARGGEANCPSGTVRKPNDRAERRVLLDVRKFRRVVHRDGWYPTLGLGVASRYSAHVNEMRRWHHSRHACQRHTRHRRTYLSGHALDRAARVERLVASPRRPSASTASRVARPPRPPRNHVSLSSLFAA